MIRTCRVFFPGRVNYNVSVFNRRTSQSKQSSMEFSFYVEQWKDIYLLKKLKEQLNAKFSTFKDREKIDFDRNHQKNSNTTPSDYTPFKAKKEAVSKENLSSVSQSEEYHHDFPTSKKKMEKTLNPQQNIEPLKLETFGALKESPYLEGFQNADGNEEVKNISSSPPQVKSNKMAHNEIIKSLKVLVNAGSRKTSDLSYLSDLILNSNTSLSLLNISTVLYSFARLNYANLPLLELMAKQTIETLKEEKYEPNAKVLISLLQSVCTLRYRNTELVEILCKNISRVLNLLDLEQTALCLFAVSNINLKSDHLDAFIDVLSKVNNTDFKKTRNFLNYVWATVILEKHHLLPFQHIEAVLSKSFYDKLIVSGDNNLISRLKLANISGVASTLKNYGGPFLNHMILSPVLTKSKSNFLSAVRDSLSYIFPKVGYTEPLSYAGSGVFIDVECCLDSSFKPVPLKSKEKSHKMGIVLLDYSDYCLGEDSLTGINAFKLKRIKDGGYKVVAISHREFPFNQPLSNKTAFLQNKLRRSITTSQ